jgi:ubiquinone/menaquinone biosynthesis C-methylase UbiE
MACPLLRSRIFIKPRPLPPKFSLVSLTTKNFQSINYTKTSQLNMSTGPTLAPSAQSGFADGASYDAHRPSYPSTSVTTLLSNLKVASGARILDLAAGTGKFTVLLAARPENYSIVAVEPHDGMRTTLAEKSLPRVEVKKGFATAIPLADGAVDAVIVAQAFHWFATADALREIARVLKPHGRLGLIWNIEDYNNTLTHESPHPWTLKLREFLFARDTKEDSIRFRNERWRAIFNNVDAISFGPLREAAEEWRVALSEEELWARWRTLSQIAAMKDDSEELQAAQAYFEDALKGDGTERDKMGRIVVRGETVCGWTQKKD